jgi:hypothetical protein
VKDPWNRIRVGGPPATAGLVLLLLAGVGYVLVLAGVRFPIEAGLAPRAVLGLLGLVLALASFRWWVIRPPTLDRPGRATVARWRLLLLGLSQTCITAALLLSHR